MAIRKPLVVAAGVIEELPSGDDLDVSSIATAAAVAVGTTNAEGSATTLARSDHTHEVTGLKISGEVQGDILYFNGSAWVRLAPGTAGQKLQTNGAGANPTWSTSGAGDVTSAANIADNRIVRGDGGAKGVQESAASIDDNGHVLPVTHAAQNLGALTNRWLGLFAQQPSFGVSVVSTTQTLGSSTYVVCDAGTYTLTLPSITSSDNGRTYLIDVRASAAVVTLSKQPADTINSGGAIALEPGARYWVFSIEGESNWRALKLSGLDEAVAFTGDITPAALSASQNNYNPAGLAAASVLRLSATGSGINITGLAGGADGRLIVIHNVGVSFQITLTHEDAASSAANRFDLRQASSVVIQQRGSILLQYDATSSRWRVVGVQDPYGTAASTICQGNDSRLSNDRTASGIRTATTVVAVSSATAPSSGQVLTATSSTAANWQTPTALPTASSATATGTITTTSATDVLATGMTLTPAAGTYVVWFTGSVSDDTNNQTVFTSIYAAGAQVAASQRRNQRGNSIVETSFACTATVTVNGSQTIQGQWRVTGGTGSMYERTLLIMRVA